MLISQWWRHYTHNLFTSDDGDCHFLDQPTQSTNLKSDGFSTNDEISDDDIIVDEEVIRDSASRLQATRKEMDQGDGKK